MEETRARATLQRILLTYAIPLIVTILLTWAMYDWALDIQSGVEHIYTGRKARYEALPGKLIGLLGPGGVLIVGGVIAGYYGYRLVWPGVGKVRLK